MSETDAPGPRIDAAKAAAHGLIDVLPAVSSVALETYGTTTSSDNAAKDAGCRDVTVLRPLGPLDRGAINAAIDRLAPSGYTPISLALQTAANQLAADNSPQAVVLVSDGEDTCGTPPCDTAAQLRKSHPALAISTVGFKVDGPAADQLRCIADVTGGVFVQAANAAQLAARLLATQNIDQANSSMNSTGIGDINLGAKITEIRFKHKDFPDAAATGSVTVTWRDCDFGFIDGILDSIRPHGGGRTIDGLSAGAPVDKAGQLYGKPLATKPGTGGTTNVIFNADEKSEAAYDITVEGFSDANSALAGIIKNIVLCRCKPHAGASAGPEPERVVVKPVDSHGSTMPGFGKDSQVYTNPLDCTSNMESPYDITQGVRRCGANAESADACWPTANGTYVLCLLNPWDRYLSLRPAEGATSPLPPHEPSTRPMGIELEDGTRCRAVAGGAWSLRSDATPAYYMCKGGSGHADAPLWATPTSDPNGITRGPDGWTVQLGETTGPLSTLKVTKIYFVGMA
ncbi:von Willebrand factor A [Mycobacteroides abscessus subsp. abscessus]|nr:von Willebrand factor A [Mycobacteroides abscessus subsp. abscessus]